MTATAAEAAAECQMPDSRCQIEEQGQKDQMITIAKAEQK